jgi:hypothetical protein
MENLTQKVATLPHFFFRLSSYGVFAMLLLILSVSAGTFGYHHFSDLNWLDSFHMSCMILTGMGPITEMDSASAKLFSSFFALYSGVAFLSITAVFFAPIIHRLLHILHVENDQKL